MKNHWGQHDDDCFACRIQTVQFQGVSARAIDVRKRDKQFDKDNDAYRRLRKEGLQPRGTEKVALLESQADHKTDVFLGRKTTDTERKAFTREYGAI